MKSQIVPHIQLFIVALIYGANYSIAKSIMPEWLTPDAFIFIRIASGALAFWILAPLFGSKEKINKTDFPRLIVCGLTGTAMNQLFFFKGLVYTSSVNASVIMTLSPILVLIISAIILRTRMTMFKITGIILGAIGAALLLGQKNFNLDNDSFIGDLFVLINASSYAFYLVLVKPLMVKYDAMTVVKWVFTFGLVFIFPFGISDAMQTSYAIMPWTVILRISYVVICTTILAYMLNLFAMKRVNPSVVGAYIYLQPVCAMLISVFILNNDLTLEKIIYSLLIFIGVYMVSQPRFKKKAA
ncbi:DMT family transporter [Mangrovivirga sp. M17]|uniref:DMT family transporter n=1 Tax=Mangrovivirga halotolerans TaxID=2993936 RepID=A0ABT3RP11_9BACT|nr:DMT family transporter [Mangrovivirga halotolerans]MCX2742900.1 DMT family transporter [Mangrovivirga halotolerans]